MDLNPWRREGMWSARTQFLELQEVLAEHGLVHEMPTALEMVRYRDIISHSWWFGWLAPFTAAVWAVCAAGLLAGTEYQLWVVGPLVAIGPLGWFLCSLWRRAARAKLEELVLMKPKIYDLLVSRYL